MPYSVNLPNVEQHMVESSPSGVLSTTEVRRRITDDLDFVHLKRFDYSLNKLVERYPEGCPTRLISQALMITEDDVDELYQTVVAKLRTAMGVEE